MNLSVFFESLKVMVEGMGGIFAVILIFYMLITILTKTFPEKSN